MAKAKVTEKNIKLILQGSMGKAILALAVPVVINSFLQTMYNLTDTYWLGQPFLSSIIKTLFKSKTALLSEDNSAPFICF